MNNYIVYCHTNKINQKKYIGVTKQNPTRRWREGNGYKSQNKFYNAIEKYGWAGFTHEILFSNLSEIDAYTIEAKLIKDWNTIANGYNVEVGGNSHSHSKIAIEKSRLARLGKKLSPQSCKNIKKSKIETVGNKVFCVELNTVFPSMGEAMRITGIDKSSISRCCKGKQIVAGGYHWYYCQSDYSSSRKDERKKSVICLNTNKEYESVADAARDTNSDPSNIIKVCNGKYKTTNKLKWAWKGEADD